MQYFGTDGIRGNVEETLHPDFCLKIASAAGAFFKEEGIKKICIGKDPRVSSSFIMDLLIGGLKSQACEVINLGTVSTPVVSYTIINNKDIDAGIMISASHNPYYDNGIKFFGKDGKKISQDYEEKIENKIDKNNKIDIESIGKEINGERYVDDYISYCIDQGIDLNEKKIAIDCSNGSAYKIAFEIFEKLNANISIIANEPDGYNINDKVGSTHTETISKFIKENDFDFGFSYDGDADRIMLLDSNGNVLDGDYILYMLAKYYKEDKKLKKNAIVSTVMTNLGFKNAIKKIDVNNYETSVGDKYVMRELDEREINIGGEQSGHIIISDLLPTGDGILTSVILSKLIVEKNIDLMELQKELRKYPQTLLNYKCLDKEKIMNNKKLFDDIKEIEKSINEEGRILVRASGTENLIRVMVEHKDEIKCNEIANIIVEKIKKI